MPSNRRAISQTRAPTSLTACHMTQPLEILEIGCGTGATGALALSEGCCGRFVGVELFETAAAEAREVLSEVITGNVETLEFDLQPAPFDADHLLRSSRTSCRTGRSLEKPVALCPSGWHVARQFAEHLALAGYPRIGHGPLQSRRPRRVRPHPLALVHARLPSPILATKAGFDVEELGPVTAFSPRTELISRLTGGRFDHLFMTQIAMIARKR